MAQQIILVEIGEDIVELCAFGTFDEAWACKQALQQANPDKMYGVRYNFGQDPWYSPDDETSPSDEWTVNDETPPSDEWTVNVP